MQWRVVEELYKGKSDKEIGAALNLSFKTVKSYMVAINRLIGTNKRTQIMLKFSEWLKEDAAQAQAQAEPLTLTQGEVILDTKSLAEKAKNG